MKIFIALLTLVPVLAIDNGLGLKPPMGWRSWNLYGANVNQSLMTSIMDGMVSRKRIVDGKPTSLCDLGFCDVGLDDNWQVCGKSPNGKYTFHDDNGNPIVNLKRFPDFNDMTDYAHRLGLTAGWYLNNCICSDSCADAKCYEGDVRALHRFGFDAVKLDGCSKEFNLDEWATLINATGKPIMIENCHWGQTLPTDTWCPFNFYRTSGDIRASFGNVIMNLMTVPPLADKGLSKPGCWAYPDMLEVGCADGPGGASDKGLTPAETRSHFAAWCVVSSPLTLSHDVNNDSIMDKIWPVISNREALAVNQAYFGHSGSQFKPQNVEIETVHLKSYPGVFRTDNFLYFYKPMSADRSQFAVLLINTDRDDSDLTFDFSDVPGFIGADRSVHIRDIFARKDVGVFSKSFTAPKVLSHDCAFLMLTVVA